MIGENAARERAYERPQVLAGPHRARREARRLGQSLGRAEARGDKRAAAYLSERLRKLHRAGNAVGLWQMSTGIDEG